MRYRNFYRILVFQALSFLLNSKPFSFVIDLAVLASRREYLKLDKWLNDKIGEHREEFIQACVNFLKRRCPSIVGMYVLDYSDATITIISNNR